MHLQIIFNYLKLGFTEHEYYLFPYMPFSEFRLFNLSSDISSLSCSPQIPEEKGSQKLDVFLKVFQMIVMHLTIVS